MKLLIIANEINDMKDITNYTDMWSHYLSSSFKQCNVEIIYHTPQFVNGHESDFIKSIISCALTNNVDHILALGVRYFTKIPREIGNELSKSFNGLVCQVHDGSLLDGAPIDVNFTVRDDDWRYHGNENNRLDRHLRYNYHIGWAADSVVFFPEQKQDILQVFVDHSTFTDTSPDYSLNILMSLKRLKIKVENGELSGFNDLIIKTLTCDGVVDVDLDNITIKPYNRKSVPLPVFSKELRKSHIFIVTHNESVGLSVLEAAHCGAYIIAPDNTINPDRLELVQHMTFYGSIDWESISDKINPELNSLFVKSQNWNSVVYNILKGLIMMKKRNHVK